MKKLNSIFLTMIFLMSSFAMAEVSNEKEMTIQKQMRTGLFGVHIKAGVAAKEIRHSIVATGRLTGKVAVNVLKKSSDVVVFTGERAYLLASRGVGVLGAGAEVVLSGTKNMVIFVGASAKLLARQFAITLGKVGKTALNVTGGVVLFSGKVAGLVFNTTLRTFELMAKGGASLVGMSGVLAKKSLRGGAQIISTSVELSQNLLSLILRSGGVLIATTAKGSVALIKFTANTLLQSLKIVGAGTLVVTKAALNIGCVIYDVAIQSGKIIVTGVVGFTKGLGQFTHGLFVGVGRVLVGTTGFIVNSTESVFNRTHFSLRIAHK